MRKKIQEWREKRNFPVILQEKYIDYDKQYPLWMIADKVKQPNQRIPLDKIYGSNWCFEDEKNRGNYPKPTKLLSLLDGYEHESDIPPIDLYFIDGKYFLREGNHRVYLFYLLERYDIVANVWIIHYDEFLQKSKIRQEDEWGGVIEFKGELYEINEEELHFYKKRKGL